MEIAKCLALPSSRWPGILTHQSVRYYLSHTWVNEAAVVFNALALISYNQYSKSFAMKSHVMDGNQTDAYFKILSENNFEWGFETPAKAKIKYTIMPVSKTTIAILNGFFKTRSLVKEEIYHKNHQ